MKKFIPVNRPYIDKSDEQYIINNSIKKNNVTNSPLISLFEEKISNLCDRKYAVSVTSGTTALEIAVKSLNLPSKSKILLPSFTIVSVLNAVLKNNLIPVFIDVKRNDYNISINELLKFKPLKHISAAIIVSTYNSASEIDKVINCLKKNNIKIIEDAAESFGGSYKNKPFGSFGDISILSFYSNKLITTGEGGMILTNNKKIFNYCNKSKNLFFDEKNRNFSHKEIGSNYRFPSILAALGISQLKKIKYFINHRQKLYNYYFFNLNSELLEFQNIKKDIKSSYWVFPVILKLKNLKFDSKFFINELNKENIQARHFFYPLPDQPFFKKKISKKFKINARYIYKYGLYLP